MPTTLNVNMHGKSTSSSRARFGGDSMSPVTGTSGDRFSREASSSESSRGVFGKPRIMLTRDRGRRGTTAIRSPRRGLQGAMRWQGVLRHCAADGPLTKAARRPALVMFVKATIVASRSNSEQRCVKTGVQNRDFALPRLSRAGVSCYAIPRAQSRPLDRARPESSFASHLHTLARASQSFALPLGRFSCTLLPTEKIYRRPAPRYGRCSECLAEKPSAVARARVRARSEQRNSVCAILTNQMANARGFAMHKFSRTRYFELPELRDRRTKGLEYCAPPSPAQSRATECSNDDAHLKPYVGAQSRPDGNAPAQEVQVAL